MPIKLTNTLQGDLIIKIIKVKPGLHVSCQDRKHIFKAFKVCLSLHIVVSDCSVHISQEIFTNDILTALKPSLEHDSKHVLRLLRLYGDQA